MRRDLQAAREDRRIVRPRGHAERLPRLGPSTRELSHGVARAVPRLGRRAVPAINVLAYPHVDRAWPPDDSDYTLTFDVNGRKAPYNDGIVYPAIATMPGRPATTFPVGRSREGLPIGLQGIGPYLEDFTPIRFAALLAKEIGGFVSPDGF